MKKLNPDVLIEALEKVCERYKVSLNVNRFAGQVVIYDRDGMEVCSFLKLSGNDGPSDLEIGPQYEDTYSTSPR